MSNEPYEIQPNQIHTITLYQPPVRVLIYEMKRELQKNFRDVCVEFRISPNLHLFNLAAPGICGNTAIMEVGSLQYLLPRPQLHKRYCMRELLWHLNRMHHRNFIMGGGIHSNPPFYDHADLTANMVFEPLNNLHNGQRKLQNRNKAIWWDESKNGAKYMEVCDTTCAVQGNFFLSKGKSGFTLFVLAYNRIGPYDYLTSIQRALTKTQTCNHNQLIGLGGVFMKKSSGIIYHNMLSSSTSNINTIVQAQQWLKYNKSTEHMIGVGTILSDIFGQSYLYRYYNNERQFMHFTRLHFHSVTRSEKGGHIYTENGNEFGTDFNYGFFSLAQMYYAIDCQWQPLRDSHDSNNRIINDFTLPEQRLF